MRDDRVVLETKGLRKHFPITSGWFRRVVGAVKAVDGVNWPGPAGEVEFFLDKSAEPVDNGHTERARAR